MQHNKLYSITLFILWFTITSQVYADFNVVDERVTTGSFLGRLDLTSVNPLLAGEIEVMVGLRESNGDLKLKEYGLQAGGGSLTHVNDNSESGEALEIAMDSFDPYGGRFVTVVRTDTNRLKVIAWQVLGTSINRLGDSGNSGPLVDDVSVSMISTHRAVVAYITNTNQLSLQVWNIVDAGMSSRSGGYPSRPLARAVLGDFHHTAPPPM